MKKLFVCLTLLMSSAFAQNATLNCGSLVLTGDDGNGLITVMTSVAPLPSPNVEQYLGCCIILQPNAGTPASSYLSASCDTPLGVITHPVTITSISVSMRKNDVQFSPFETLVITTPDCKVRKFDLLFMGIGANQGNERSREWNVNMTLPVGTSIYIDAYFSANLASVCANTACIASSVWRLQGSI
jgi:hypothetical protein